MEFINLDLERKVLRCIFYKKELLVKSVNRGSSLPADIFADKSHKLLFKMMMSSFIKQGVVLDKDLLVSKIGRLSVKGRKSKLLKEKLFSVVENTLEIKPTKSVTANFDIYLDELVVLHNGRSMQELTIDLFDKIDHSDISGARDLLKGFSLLDKDDGVDMGDYDTDFTERENEVLKKKNNPDLYSLLPSGIEHLDVVLEGGFDKELVIISGSSNAGKSMLIEQIATNGYRLKKNVILVCIGEMNKINTGNRIDCNIANIDFKFFRNPLANYSKEDHDRWKEKIERCKLKCGKLGIISIRKAATVDFIMSKVYQKMNEWNVPIDGIFVDSINNIKAESKTGSKDWNDYEPICWSLFESTKNFRNLNGSVGIPIIATYQLKKASKQVTADSKGRKLREDDVAFSPYPYQYSEVFIGMKDIQEGEISELQIMKGRGISKNVGIECYHNFPYGRYHDTEKEKEVKAQIPPEDIEEMEVADE